MAPQVVEPLLSPTTRPDLASVDVLMTVLGQRYVQYYPVLADLTGSVKAALILGHMLYWSRRYLATRTERDGWFWHTRRDWYCATGLSRDEQERARRCLRDAGLISERLMGVPARVHYRIELDRLGGTIATHVAKQYLGWRWDDAFVRGLLGRSVAFLRGLTDVSGSIYAALYLSELCSVHRRTQNDPDKCQGGWMDAPIGESATRLRLSDKSLRLARSFLKERGLIRERTSGGVRPRTLTSIELNVIAQRVVASRHRVPSAGTNDGDESDSACDLTLNDSQGLDFKLMAETYIPDLPKPANWNGANVHSRPSQTRQLESRKRAIQTFPKPPTGSAQSRQLDVPKPAAMLAGTGMSINKVLSTQNLQPQLPSPGTAEARSRTPEASAVSGGGPNCGTHIPLATVQIDQPRPKDMTEVEETQALRLVAALPLAAQQLVLDEWVGQIRIPGKVSNRLGYLFTLVARAKRGDFVPLIGPQVAKERAKRQAVQAAVSRSQMPAQGTPMVPRAKPMERGAMREETRAAFNDLRRKLR